MHPSQLQLQLFTGRRHVRAILVRLTVMLYCRERSELGRGQTKCRGLIKGKEVSGMWGYRRVEHVVYISARVEYQSDEAVTPVRTH